MKKSIYILMPTLIIATGSILFYSCSADDEDYEAYDLSIEHNVTRVKLNAAETFPFNDGNNYDEIPVFEDECALYSLCQLNKNNFWEGNTATDYYNRLRNFAMDSCGYRGGAMTESTMLRVAKKFGLASESVDFTSGESSIDYFNNNDTRNIKTISIDGHTGTFQSYDSRTGTVYYSDYEGARQKCRIEDVRSIMTK